MSGSALTPGQLTITLENVRQSALKAMEAGLPVEIAWEIDLYEKIEGRQWRRAPGDQHVRIRIGQPVPDGFDAPATPAEEIAARLLDCKPLTRDEARRLEGLPPASPPPSLPLNLEIPCGSTARLEALWQQAQGKEEKG